MTGTDTRKASTPCHYRQLYERRRRLAVSPAAGGLYALAAGDSDSLALLLTSFRAPADLRLAFRGISPGAAYRCRRYLTDATHCHALFEDAPVNLHDDGLRLALGEKASVLVLLDRAAGSGREKCPTPPS